MKRHTHRAVTSRWRVVHPCDNLRLAGVSLVVEELEVVCALVPLAEILVFAWARCLVLLLRYLVSKAILSAPQIRVGGCDRLLELVEAEVDVTLVMKVRPRSNLMRSSMLWVRQSW